MYVSGASYLQTNTTVTAPTLNYNGNVAIGGSVVAGPLTIGAGVDFTELKKYFEAGYELLKEFGKGLVDYSTKGQNTGGEKEIY